jgi:hypothetical protein
MLEGKHLLFLTQGLLAVVIPVRVSQAQSSPQQPASVRLLDVMRVSVDGDPKVFLAKSFIDWYFKPKSTYPTASYTSLQKKRTKH